jgi:hypothetical protein
MKILTLSLFFLVILFFSFTTPAHSQEFNFDKAYSDYTFTFNKYRESYTDYITAKGAYLNYQTLNSKNEAKDKTLTVLQLRDDTIRTYLTALRLRLSDTTGIHNYDLNIIYLKLDNDITWYTTHHDSLSSAGTLEDLLSLSGKAANNYNSTTYALSYSTLYSLISFRENDVYTQMSQHLDNIKNELAQIRQNGDKNTAVAERWLLAAQEKLTRSQEKQKAAAAVNINGSNPDQAFSQASFLLQESDQYLKEANSYTKEIIREVKSAD